MDRMRAAKLVCAVAGSGVAFGLFSFLPSCKQEENAANNKKSGFTAWTTSHQTSMKWDKNWDKREPSSLIKPASKKNRPLEQNRIEEEKEKLKPTATRNIILVKHGNNDTSQGKGTDTSLTSLGCKQAHLLGKRLKELNFNFTRLVHSSMMQAVETADIILKHIPKVRVSNCNLLREGAPVSPEPPLELVPEYEYYEDGARLEAAFRKYFYRADSSQKCNSYEIIVCHENVIRYFVCRILQFPPEAWIRFRLHHCSITWIAIHPSGRVCVYTVGDSGYLPKDKITS